MTEIELMDILNPKRDLSQATCDVISKVFEVMNPLLEHANEVCKELANTCNRLESDLKVARYDRKYLEMEVEKGLKEYIKDCPYSALKNFADAEIVAENEELKAHCKAVDEVNKKIKCCQMCKHLENRGSCLKANHKEVKEWGNFLIETRRTHYCENWELAK